MKMDDVFCMPLEAMSGQVFDACDDSVALWRSTDKADRGEAAKAAAHAINCHDELVEALTALHENVEPPPEKNCSCHIAPPCGDCVEYDALRDALDRARAILNKAKGE